MKQQILKFRIQLIDKMSKYIRFCIKNSATNQHIEQVPVINNDSALEEELQEKNKFLVEIGQKINNIFPFLSLFYLDLYKGKNRVPFKGKKLCFLFSVK